MVRWRGLKILAWAVMLVASAASGSTVQLTGARVLWLGDSITQAGDYVTFVEYLLEKQSPTTRVDFVSIGLSSETVDCLSEAAHPFPRPCVQDRLERALDMVRPQVVVACYGMNDGIYHPQSADRFAAFKAGIDKIIAAAHRHGAKVVLLTPTPFDSAAVSASLLPRSAADKDFSYRHPYERYDDVLADYARWEMDLPNSDATVVDLHRAVADFERSMVQRDASFHLTRDGIHPGPLGHLAMATAILRALGYDISVDVSPAGLEQIQQDPLYQLVKQRRELVSNMWLAYVGYTREKPVKSDTLGPGTAEAEALQRRIDALRSAQ